MIVACLLLGISGGIRFWREWQFASLAATSSSPPFRLEELPRDLGNWQSIKENDSQLDPKVARIAGSSDSIIRTYLDRKSGDQMSALVIYGLSQQVFAHTPDACYPAAGYQLVERPHRSRTSCARREYARALSMGDLHEACRRDRPLS